MQVKIFVQFLKKTLLSANASLIHCVFFVFSFLKMDVDVYLTELCCAILCVTWKDLLWLNLLPGINVISSCLQTKLHSKLPFRCWSVASWKDFQRVLMTQKRSCQSEYTFQGRPLISLGVIPIDGILSSTALCTYNGAVKQNRQPCVWSKKNLWN